LDSELLELKARVKSINIVRQRLLGLRATYIGTFRQVDTYYSSPEDRLKLREVAGENKAKLITIPGRTSLDLREAKP